MEILRRVTLKNIGLTVKSVKGATQPLEDGENAPLARIVGITTMSETGQTDKGEFIRLHGDFQAINLIDGTKFSSGQCILPSFIAVQLVAALKTSPEVEFALEIGAKADEESVTGYQYTVKPLIEAETNSRLSQLLAKSKAFQALPAPAAPPAAPQAAGKAKK